MIVALIKMGDVYKEKTSARDEIQGVLALFCLAMVLSLISLLMKGKFVVDFCIIM